MPLSPSFTASGTSNPQSIVFVDTSGGTDASITDRKIYIYDTANTAIVSATDWPYAQATITISPLTSDIAANVVVQWRNVSGTTVYQVSNVEAFTEYGEIFIYNLAQNLSSQPDIINNQQFKENLSWFRTLIDLTNDAIDTGLDIYTAQNCIDIYNNMMQNQSLFF